jgi:hypothetical protein
MLDWMTLTLEAVGILIFCAWAVVPVREFGTILRHLRQKDAAGAGEDPLRTPNDSEKP